MEELIIICPSCGNKINLLDKEQEESKAIAEYKLHLRKDVEKHVRTNIEKELNEKFNLSLEKEKGNWQLEKNKEIESLKMEITKLKSNLENIEKTHKENLNSKLSEKENEFITKYNNEKQEYEKNLNFKDNEITKLKSNLENIEKTHKENLNSKLSEKENELNKEHKLELDKKNNEIFELKLLNDKLKIMSNKLRGENFEEEFETELRKNLAATNDLISKITHSGTKADFCQIVRENNLEKGKIIYECKSGEWKNSWEEKLAKDMINDNANFAILVAPCVEEKYKVPFLASDFNSNVYLASPESFVFVSSLLRKFIIVESILKEKSSNKEVYEKFNQWKLNLFENAKNIISKANENIEANERLIISKVEDIKKNRTKIWDTWQKSIVDFLDNLYI